MLLRIWYGGPAFHHYIRVIVVSAVVVALLLPTVLLCALPRVQLTSLTASMRFEGAHNVDLNEITTTLVPFPRMNLLQSRCVHMCVCAGPRANYTTTVPHAIRSFPPSRCSISPLFTHPEGGAAAASSRYVDAMFTEAFMPRHQLLRGDAKRSVHMACGLLLRGDVVISDVTRNVDKLKRELRMAAWNPDGFKTGICGAAPTGRPYSLLALSNNTGVVTTLSAAYTRFMALYRVRAHVHHYTQYMEAEEFTTALASLTDVISAYNEGTSRAFVHACACERVSRPAVATAQHPAQHPRECAVESAEDGR